MRDLVCNTLALVLLCADSLRLSPEPRQRGWCSDGCVAHLDRHLGEVVRVPETSGDVEPKVLAVFYHILPKTNILQ